MKLFDIFTAVLFALGITFANFWSHSTLPTCSAEQVKAENTANCAIRS